MGLDLAADGESARYCEPKPNSTSISAPAHAPEPRGSRAGCAAPPRRAASAPLRCQRCPPSRPPSRLQASPHTCGIPMTRGSRRHPRQLVTSRVARTQRAANASDTFAGACCGTPRGVRVCLHPPRPTSTEASCASGGVLSSPGVGTTRLTWHGVASAAPRAEGCAGQRARGCLYQAHNSGVFSALILRRHAY